MRNARRYPPPHRPASDPHEAVLNTVLRSHQVLKRGDYVRIRRAGRVAPWCTATVFLASPNGKLVVLALNGFVRAKLGGTYVSDVMPLSIDSTLITDLSGTEYEIEVVVSSSLPRLA